MIKDPRMNAGWLRAFLFEEKKIRRPSAKWDLSDNVLQVLAIHIFTLAHHHREPPPSRPAVEAYADATQTRNLVEAAQEQLEKLRVADTVALADWNERPDHDPHKLTQIDRCNKQIRRLSAAISVLADLVPYLKSSLRWPPKTTWKHHAVGLAKLFICYVRRDNPDHSIRISEEGPAVSFVQAAILAHHRRDAYAR